MYQQVLYHGGPTPPGIHLVLDAELPMKMRPQQRVAYTTRLLEQLSEAKLEAMNKFHEDDYSRGVTRESFIWDVRDRRNQRLPFCQTKSFIISHQGERGRAGGGGGRGEGCGMGGGRSGTSRGVLPFRTGV